MPICGRCWHTIGFEENCHEQKQHLEIKRILLFAVFSNVNDCAGDSIMLYRWPTYTTISTTIFQIISCQSDDSGEVLWTTILDPGDWFACLVIRPYTDRCTEMEKNVRVPTFQWTWFFAKSSQCMITRVRRAQKEEEKKVATCSYQILRFTQELFARNDLYLCEFSASAALLSCSLYVSWSLSLCECVSRTYHVHTKRISCLFEKFLHTKMNEFLVLLTIGIHLHGIASGTRKHTLGTQSCIRQSMSCFHFVILHVRLWCLLVSPE